MAGKIPFTLRPGAGYVLGTRAGRAQYKRIKTTALKVAEQPFVRTRVDAASNHVKQVMHTRDEVVAEKVADTVKERLFGTPPGKGGTRSQPIDTGQASVHSVGGSS